MRRKELFTFLFFFLTITLMLLPFLLTFNDVITKIVEKFTLYTLLENVVVPFQARVIQLLLTPIGIHAIAYQDGLLVQGKQLLIGWNCLGWQSMLLFFASLLIGLRHHSYKALSMFEVIILGLFGIFWVNLFRMVFIVILTVFAPPFYKFIYHDVLAAIVTIIYLFFFWWFVYEVILEETD